MHVDDPFQMQRELGYGAPFMATALISALSFVV